MENGFRCDAVELARVLRAVKPCKVNRSFRPGAEVKFTTNWRTGHVQVERVGFGLEVLAASILGAECYQPTGSAFTVDAQALAGVLKGVKGAVSVGEFDGTVSVLTDGATSTLRAGQVEDWPRFNAGENGWRLVGELATSTIVDAGAHASRDDLRPILTALLLEADGRVTATDSYRLVTIAGTPVLDVDANGILLPDAHGLATIVGRWGVDTVTLERDDRYVRLSSPGRTLTTRIMEGEFPNYQQLLPTSTPCKVSFENAGDVVRFCKSVPAAVDAVQFRAVGTGGIELAWVKAEHGSGAVTVPGSVDGPADDLMLVAFNPRFVLTLVPASGGFVLEGVDRLKPWQVQEGKARRLLMPVRVAD